MATDYIAYQLPNDIEVEMRVLPSIGDEDEQVGLEDRVVHAAEEFDAALGMVSRVVNHMAQQLRQRLDPAADCELVFRANMSGKASIKVFEAAGDAGIEIHLSWKGNAP